MSVNPIAPRKKSSKTPSGLFSGLSVKGKKNSTLAKSSEMSQAIAPPLNYVSVVSLQAFNGSWKLDDQLASMTSGLSQQQLIDAAPVKSLDIWATAVALALLTSKFADKKDEWEMIEMKARQWLNSQPLEGQSDDDLIELAIKLLTTV